PELPPVDPVIPAAPPVPLVPPEAPAPPPDPPEPPGLEPGSGPLSTLQAAATGKAAKPSTQTKVRQFIGTLQSPLFSIDIAAPPGCSLG
ncbi:MAG TPA: hypothetical protein VFH73_15655, partial [Polyangia bacterium]|nr:hypothetical protein [Polyangia bacterium]